jgi:hypothetical protein
VSVARRERGTVFEGQLGPSASRYVIRMNPQALSFITFLTCNTPESLYIIESDIVDDTVAELAPSKRHV